MSVTFPADGIDSTLSNIIEQALLELQAIGLGETIDTDTNDMCVYRFNSMVLSLDTPLVAKDAQTLTILDGVTEYTTPDHTSKVLDFDDANINVILTEDYYKLLAQPNDGKTYATVDYSDSPPKIKFINPPDVDEVVTFRRSRTPVVLTSVDKPKYPIEATEMLILGLASKLAAGYGVDQGRRLELKNDFETAKRNFDMKQRQREGDEIVTPTFVV